jgi:hypothetical protein
LRTALRAGAPPSIGSAPFSLPITFSKYQNYVLSILVPIPLYDQVSGTTITFISSPDTGSGDLLVTGSQCTESQCTSTLSTMGGPWPCTNPNNIPNSCQENDYGGSGDEVRTIGEYWTAPMLTNASANTGVSIDFMSIESVPLDQQGSSMPPLVGLAPVNNSMAGTQHSFVTKVLAGLTSGDYGYTLDMRPSAMQLSFGTVNKSGTPATLMDMSGMGMSGYYFLVVQCTGGLWQPDGGKAVPISYNGGIILDSGTTTMYSDATSQAMKGSTSGIVSIYIQGSNGQKITLSGRVPDTSACGGTMQGGLPLFGLWLMCGADGATGRGYGVDLKNHVLYVN